jgi:hypothetical protein
MNNTCNKSGQNIWLKAIAVLLIGLNCFLAQGHDIPLNQAREKQQRKKDCLEISAEATSNGLAIKGLTIRIYRGTDLVIEIPSTEKKKMFFSLQENSNYTIAFAKAGYVTRSISVDTHLPEEMSTGPAYRFEFELCMLEEDPALNSYYLDFPVALVGFNKKTERFEYNRGYTDRIRKGSGETLSYSLQENSGK